MKINNIIKSAMVIIGVLLLTNCSAYDSATDLLTPVDNPLEYQNDFFPIEVGTIYKYNKYSLKDSQLVLTSRVVSEVTEYRDSRVRLGRRILNIPVFRLIQKEFKIDSTLSVKEEYYIKTKEGIVITPLLSKTRNLEMSEFIPSSPTFDPIREDLINWDVLDEVHSTIVRENDTLIHINAEHKIHSSRLIIQKSYAKNRGLIREIRELDGDRISIMILTEDDPNAK